MVDEEERAAATGAEEYLNREDPSILRFLIASRDVASARQLRDDLLGMLVAGHETTASVLTWTAFLLCGRPECLAKVQVRAARAAATAYFVAPGPRVGVRPDLRWPCGGGSSRVVCPEL